VRSCEETGQRRQDALVSFTQERGQNVFADAVAPQVIAAVAARVGGGAKVDPVLVAAVAGDAVTAIADALTMEPEAPLQSIEVHAAGGLEVDHHIR
jgi:hypothetical protein